MSFIFFQFLSVYSAICAWSSPCKLIGCYIQFEFTCTTVNIESIAMRKMCNMKDVSNLSFCNILVIFYLLIKKSVTQPMFKLCMLHARSGSQSFMGLLGVSTMGCSRPYPTLINCFSWLELYNLRYLIIYFFIFTPQDSDDDCPWIISLKRQQFRPILKSRLRRRFIQSQCLATRHYIVW